MATKATKAENTKEFAVIMTGGKQYKVSVGDVISVEKINDDLKAGDTVTFDSVLLTDNGSDTTVGAPHVSGVKVTGTLEEAGRGAKVTVIKYKQKSRYFVKNGHRQPFMKVKIGKIA
jgi:large subunit ribosomal protein L21